MLDAYKSALDKAALEAFEGRYEAEAIAAMIDRNLILNQAMELILEETWTDISYFFEFINFSIFKNYYSGSRMSEVYWSLVQ